ncbi:MAG: hypothetical protein HC853_09340 [Anaerolineae bacterium]|nr:hypothetical protein [Anaerolineae bacterium]
MNFVQKLKAAQQRNQSALCIALDVVVANSPLPILYSDEPMLPFARAMIDATKDLVCAYKVNLAYFLPRAQQAWWRSNASPGLFRAMCR